MNYIIYALCNPEELGGSIRYIGKSTYGLARTKEHRKRDSLAKHSHKNNWILGLRHHGMDYQIMILDSVDDSLSKNEANKLLIELEIKHIAAARAGGINLTNLTDGGEGTTGYVHTEDTLALLSLKRSAWHQRNNPTEIMNLSCYKKVEYIWMDDIPFYKCSMCKLTKEIHLFKKGSRSDGLGSECKPCAAQRTFLYRLENPTVKLTAEQLKQNYKDRGPIHSKNQTERMKDPAARAASGVKNKKAIIGTNELTKQILHFPSASEAKKQGFCNVRISECIISGRLHKGFKWEKV